MATIARRMSVPAAVLRARATCARPLAGLLRVLLVAGLAGCQGSLALMPTPEVLTDPRFNVFTANPTPLTSNQIETFYVTTRTPAERPGATFFTGKPQAALHFGSATARIGPENLGILELFESSTSEDRERKLVWSVIEAPILGSVTKSAAAAAEGELPPALRPFFEKLNAAIDRSITHQLTVYAHGANNTFEWSVAQGAQYQYFTGNNEAMLTFSWPSPGRALGYGKDKQRADAAATDLAWLLELLVRHASAERINIVAFSAGGRVAGRALALLGERHPMPAHPLLGRVYLAQSDQPLDDFLTALPTFHPLLDALTVTANPGDPVLRLARLTDREARLGAAEREAVTETLGPDDAAQLRIGEIINSDTVSVIDLSRNLIQGFEFSHGAWYDNPWVSTDALVYLLLGLAPQQRGLDSYVSDLGYRIWYFPEDYLERIKAALLARRANDEAADAAPR